MLDQSINNDSLQPILTGRIRRKYPLSFKRNDESFCSDIIHSHKSSLPFFPFKTKRVKGKLVYTFQDAISEVLHDKLCYNLKAINKLQQSNRHLIVRVIKRLLEDRNQFGILRLDIQQFYENISLKDIIAKLERDTAYSKTTVKLINRLNDLCEFDSIEGLPRGIAVSAALSEYKMRAIDREIKKTEGVYFYTRFVDDIIIFTYNDIHQLEASVLKMLEDKGLSVGFSEDKYFKKLIKKSEVSKHWNHYSFDYLGYNFKFSDQRRQKYDPREVNIDLADKKRKKLKTKLIKAFVDYKKNKDNSLLKTRLRILTSNYYIKSSSRSTLIRTGIYYNYPLINTINHDSSRIVELDRFKNRLIFDENLQKKLLGKSLLINSNLKRELAKMSFKNGWEDRVFFKISVSQMKKAKRNWAY